jgi:hypothetical protein
VVARLDSGVVVAGRYRLDRLLGAGGMGAVWAAARVEGGAPVALKFVKDPAAGRELRRRFLREARAACAVRHPNVVAVHEILELEDGEPVMVMDLLVGEPFSERLRREHQLPLADTATILLPVVSAVGTAHALGIVHRDLKPENIFLALDDDGNERVVVLDFGIAKLTAAAGAASETTGLTETGSLLGTPCFMSPEQVFGEKDIDHRTDIWALGLILYQALSGVLPTLADNVGQVLKIILTRPIWPLEDAVTDIPDDVARLVNRMLTRERRERPCDLREVYRVLAKYTDAVAPQFGPPTARTSERSAVTDARDPEEPTARGGDSGVDVLGRTLQAASNESGRVVLGAEARIDPLGHVAGAAADSAPRRRRRLLPWAAGTSLAGLGFAIWMFAQPRGNMLRPSEEAVGASAPNPSAEAPRLANEPRQETTVPLSLPTAAADVSAPLPSAQPAVASATVAPAVRLPTSRPIAAPSATEVRPAPPASAPSATPGSPTLKVQRWE